jgi:hypothetical protein
MIRRKGSNHPEIARSEFTNRRNAVRLADLVGDLAWASRPRLRPSRHMCYAQELESVVASSVFLVRAGLRLKQFRCGTSFQLADKQNVVDVRPVEIFQKKITPSHQSMARRRLGLIKALN